MSRLITAGNSPTRPARGRLIPFRHKTGPTLTKKDLETILDYEPLKGRFHWKTKQGSGRPGRRAGFKEKPGYRRIQINGRAWPESHLVWLIETGHLPPSDKCVDHINRVRSDNRFCNLRLADRAENQANRKTSTRNKTGFKGIHWVRKTKKWKAEIYARGKRYCLGSYSTKEEAGAAYLAAQREHFGEFADAG